MVARISIAPFGARTSFFMDPGAACFAALHTCPWLPYSAPSALGVRGPARQKGEAVPRHSPLATLFRAFGARRLRRAGAR